RFGAGVPHHGGRYRRGRRKVRRWTSFTGHQERLESASRYALRVQPQYILFGEQLVQQSRRDRAAAAGTKSIWRVDRRADAEGSRVLLLQLGVAQRSQRFGADAHGPNGKLQAGNRQGSPDER